MSVELRKKLRKISGRNKSLQDILASNSLAKKMISVERVSGGIHNTKLILSLPDGQERVHFYNRIELNDILNVEDVPSGSLDQIIHQLNLKGYDFNTDDLQINDGYLSVPETSLGYYSDHPLHYQPSVPAELKPLILSFGSAPFAEIRSHSPLKIDWGSTSREQEDIAQDGEFTEDLTYYEGVPVYTYRKRLDFFSIYGNRVRITHADEQSPIDWLGSTGFYAIEQWYSGGFSSFECKVEPTWSGLGLKYILPDHPPPNSPDLSFMLQGGMPIHALEDWDMSEVEKIDYFFGTETEILGPVDLSRWSTPKITTAPQGWNYSGEFTLIQPNWGTTVTREPEEKDLDSMIISMLDVRDGDIAFLSSTELEIDPGTSGYRFELASQEESYGYYAYLSYRDPNATYLDRLKEIAIRPASGSGQIKDFGCSRATIMRQWWKDGYNGFNPSLGVMCDLLPLTAPPNTTNISYLLRHDYIAISNMRFWDMSQFTNFSYLFKNRIYVNDDISDWDMRNCQNAMGMFERSRYRGPSISKWNMGKCTNMANMFMDVEFFADSTEIPMGVEDFTPYIHDLSQWCTPLIARKPAGFNQDSVIPEEKCPVWGTCPRGEYIPSPVEEPEEPGDGESPYIGDWMEITHHMSGSPYITTSSNLEFDMEGEHPFTIQQTQGYLDGNFTVLGRMYYIQFVDGAEPSEYGIDRPIRFRNAEAGQPICDLNLGVSQTISKWCKDGYTQSSSLRDNQLIPAGMGMYLKAVPPVAPPNTTTLYGFFASCLYLNSANLQQWNVENVTDLRYFLYSASSFARDLSYWCVSNIQSEPLGFSTGTTLPAGRLPVWGTCPVYVPPEPPTPGDGSWMELTDVYAMVFIISLGELEFDFSDPTAYIATESEPVDEEGNTVYQYAIYTGAYMDGRATMGDGQILDEIIRVRPVNSDKMPSFNTLYVETIKTWYAGGYSVHPLMAEPDSPFAEEMGGPAGGMILNIPATMPPNTTNFTHFFSGGVYSGSVEHWDMRNVTSAHRMFFNAAEITGDYSKWCVPLLTEEPFLFAQGTSLGAANLPVWGTCPLG